MKMKRCRKSGFTLVEVMIVVSTIGLLAAIAFPNYVRARQGGQKNVCLANQRQIDTAITAWALDARKGRGVSVETSELFGSENYIREKPICPTGVDYTYHNVGEIPQVECLELEHTPDE